MRSRVSLFVVASLICFSGNLYAQVQAQAQSTVTVEVAQTDIRAELLPSLEGLQKSFNEGKAEDFAGFFLEDGEFVDERGAVHSGRAAVKELMIQFFKDYPGVQLGVTVDSLRQLGPDLLIEEGTREIFATDAAAPVAKVRYVAVRAKRDGSGTSQLCGISTTTHPRLRASDSLRLASLSATGSMKVKMQR